MNNPHYQRLTKGAIGHILNGAKIEEPVLQLLAFKNTSNESAKRYRLVMSDGAYTYQLCIIMGDLVDRIETEFDRYCLIKVSRYMLNEIQNRQVIVLAEPKLLVRGSEIGERLGEPAAFGSESAPPLSNFEANYHVRANDMDVEFDNDLDDIDGMPNVGLQQPNASARNAPANNSRRGAPPKLMGGTLNPQTATPISSINQYNNKWTIKGRCTAKTNKRSWSNAKGEGTLFSFDLKDSSGDIRITAFKAECEQYFDFVRIGEVYLMSGGRVKEANKQYTKTTSGYEITLGNDSVLELCNDASSCPEITYDFKKIDQLSDHLGGFCDVAAVIKTIGNVETVMKKGTNKELHKRDLFIVDDSKAEIILTIWGETATNLTAEVGSVVIGRGIRVSEFNGLSLSSTTNSTVDFDPDMEEVHQLKGWWSRVKDNLTTKNLTEKRGGGSFQADWKNLNEISPENVAANILSLQTKGVISQMGKTTFYKGCQTCNKKLLDLNNGFYRCEKCTQETSEFKYRIILSFSIADHTHHVWVQTFHEESMKLLGADTNLDELYGLAETSTNEFEDRIKQCTFNSYIFKVRAKMEHYNDEARVRTTVSGMHPVNHLEYGNELLKQIRAN